MQVHGLAVQQERFSGRGHEFYEPFPNPDVPTPECVQWLLTTSGFLMNVMLFTNLRLLLSLLPCLSAMYRGVPSFPSFKLAFPALPEICWKPLPERYQIDQDLLTTHAF